MIEKAFLFANKAHEGQVRKDGKTYISHPVMVAMELAKNGADDDLICAGLLHDVIEDAHVSKETLKEEFNENIVSLVARDSEDKSKSWEERKEKVIDDVKNGDRRYKMLICADKLSNLKDVQADIKKNGDVIWTRFKRGKQQQAWFNKKLLEALNEISDTQMYQEFKEIIEDVFDKGGTQ